MIISKQDVFMYDPAEIKVLNDYTHEFDSFAHCWARPSGQSRRESEGDGSAAQYVHNFHTTTCKEKYKHEVHPSQGVAIVHPTMLTG